MLTSHLKSLESTGKWYVIRIFADFSDRKFKLDAVVFSSRVLESYISITLISLL